MNDPPYPPGFSSNETLVEPEQLLKLFRFRRDVRRFKRELLPSETIAWLIHAASHSPSVGLSQPWRFVSVDDSQIRDEVAVEFETQNDLARGGYEVSDASAYARLKLAGLREAPEHLAVFVDSDCRQGRGLGRATMPEMLAYSVVLSVGQLWLAARSLGVGVGWVSILRPGVIESRLCVPKSWKLVAYLCLGFPERDDDDVPELERDGWEHRGDWKANWTRI